MVLESLEKYKWLFSTLNTETDLETVWAVELPCFLNASKLLVEVDVFHQLLLQHLLLPQDLLEERMLEEVHNVGSQLKVLNQTSGRQVARNDKNKTLNHWGFFQLLCSSSVQPF